MNPIDICVTYAFCKDGAGGNPAGIVFNHPELTNEEKMAVSAKLGFSETAFVTSSDKADYKLEYFTPTEEVPLCGHATIATFATLHKLGALQTGSLTMETKAGLLELSVGEDGLIMMEQNPPRYYETVTEQELQPCLGDGLSKQSSQIVSTGLKDIIVPFQSPEALHQARPDFAAMTELSRRKQVVGIHAFALTPDKGEVDAVCRNFAPLYGIDEESATGTASCALAGYLWKQGLQKQQYIFEQGYSMNLPSRIVVKTQSQGTAIDRIFVGGYGRLQQVLSMK